MSDDGRTPGAAALHLTVGLALLRPADQSFAAVLDSWRARHVARRLSPGRIAARQRANVDRQQG